MAVVKEGILELTPADGPVGYGMKTFSEGVYRRREASSHDKLGARARAAANRDLAPAQLRELRGILNQIKRLSL